MHACTPPCARRLLGISFVVGKYGGLAMRSSKTRSSISLTGISWCLLVTLRFAMTQPVDPLRLASKGTALVGAARADNLSDVRKQIQEHAEVNAPSSDGATALLWAAYLSNVARVKDLLAAHAAVDV